MPIEKEVPPLEADGVELTTETLGGHYANQLALINSERVNVITRRLRKLVAPEIPDSALQEVACTSIVLDLNWMPAAGEIWCWMHKGKAVIYIGVAYYERIIAMYDSERVLWDRYVNENGDTLPYEPREMTDKERRKHGLAQGDIGAVCRGFKLSLFKELIELGFTADEARAAAAQKGIGIVRYDETVYAKKTQYKNKGDAKMPANGRSWQWVANKRARTDMYSRLGITHPKFKERLEAARTYQEPLPAEQPPAQGDVEEAKETVQPTGNVIEATPVDRAELAAWNDKMDYAFSILTGNQANAIWGIFTLLFKGGKRCIPYGESEQAQMMRVAIFRAVRKFHNINDPSFEGRMATWKAMPHDPSIQRFIQE